MNLSLLPQSSCLVPVFSAAWEGSPCWLHEIDAKSCSENAPAFRELLREWPFHSESFLGANWEEPSMDKCPSRGKLSANLQGLAAAAAVSLNYLEKGALGKGYFHKIVRNRLFNLRQICDGFAHLFSAV